MIKKKGDMFTSDAGAFGHGVNVVGLMGAGVAVAFREKFPKNYVTYRNACEAEMFKPGETLVTVEEGVFIFNMSSQDDPGPHARYEWTFSALLDAALQAEKFGVKTIAIPLIGCGIGGLEWAGVEYLIIAAENIVPTVEFEVWKL